MTDIIFANLFKNGFTISGFLLCSLSSLMLGAITVIVAKRNKHASSGFLVTLGILPLVVQTVIMLVNGNIGVGVAVAGAFSLVRFRSAQGSANEILFIFISMAIGLANGIGYIGIAIMLVLISMPIMLLYRLFFKEDYSKELVITIPESLDYSDVFTDIFSEFTKSSKLISVKTTNMGSLFKLSYVINLKDSASEKEFIDRLRCRNGNLEILCRYAPDKNIEL